VRERHAEPGPDLRFAATVAERVAGPAVVRLPEATLVVPRGWRGEADATGTLVLERVR
jgi:N-methylhydantoinase A